jgi:hypothetical protein
MLSTFKSALTRERRTTDPSAGDCPVGRREALPTPADALRRPLGLCPEFSAPDLANHADSGPDRRAGLLTRVKGLAKERPNRLDKIAELIF